MVDAGAIRAGKAFIELGLERRAFDRQLASVSRRLKTVASGLRTIGAGLLGIGAAGTAFFLPTIKAASDAREEFNKFSQVFQNLSGEAQKFAQQLGAAINRPARDIQQALGTFQSFFVGMGFAADDAFDLSKRMVQLGQDFASFNNISDEEAFERLISALSGSSEVLDKFGINLRGLSPKLSENQKLMERIRRISEGLGRQGALGDAERTAGDFANQMRALNGNLNELRISIGEAILPEINKFLSITVKVVQGITEWVKINPELISGIFKTVLAVTLLGGAIIGLSLAINGAVILFKVLNPELLIFSALIGGTFLALGYLVVQLTKSSQGARILGMQFADTFEIIKQGVLSNAIPQAFAVLSARIQIVWADMLFSLEKQFRQFIFGVVRSVGTIGAAFGAGIGGQGVQKILEKALSKALGEQSKAGLKAAGEQLRQAEKNFADAIETAQPARQLPGIPELPAAIDNLRRDLRNFSFGAISGRALAQLETPSIPYERQQVEELKKINRQLENAGDFAFL